MNKHDTHIENILALVDDLPSDYETVKKLIVNKMNSSRNQEELLSWLPGYVHKLPFANDWERKHLYTLVHDLLQRHTLPSYADDVLYDIETGIIGSVSV